MRRKTLVIINPKAGKKLGPALVPLIEKGLSHTGELCIEYWNDPNGLPGLLNKLFQEKFTDVVAVGGDGTVNQVAKSITGTDIRLGIVPAGSGNGLARSLGLSMNAEDTIREIATGKSIRMDYGTVNNIPFFCTSGTGFDAHIGHLFANSEKRGLQSYLSIILREILRYRAKEYTIRLNDKEYKRKAFLITVANAGQYGNDFYIAPQADMQDGKFHVVILKPFGPLSVFGIFSKIIRRRAHESDHIETFVAEQVTIQRKTSDTMHFDGEPAMQGTLLQYQCIPAGLNVIVGDKFKVS